MGLDSYSRKSLEQRAKENDRAMDIQWIKENETNDMLYTNNIGQNSSNNELLEFPGGLDQDLQKRVNAMQQMADEKRKNELNDMLYTNNTGQNSSNNGLLEFPGGLDQDLQKRVNAMQQMTGEERENTINDIFAKLDNMIENINEEEHHRARR